MESRSFLTRLFGRNSASASSKNSATVHSDKVQQHDLKLPESAAEGEDRKGEGQAQEEKHDRTADGDEVEMEKRNGDSDGSQKEGDDKEDERRGVGWKSEFPFPLRPDAEDCAFYLKTGTCKFGSNCRFNHPIQRKQQAAKEKDQEESKEKTGQFECKYYLTPEGCKYGKACRYNHSKANSVAPDIELNFLGLPIRPGEIDCPFYMRTGTCKFSANCKFNHPDPTSGADSPVEHSDRGSAALQSASEFPVCSPSGAFNNKFPPYVPVIYSPIQVVSPPNAGWNGYPFPLKPQPLGRNMHPPPVYIINSPTTTDNHIHRNHQQQMGVEEFPERPGQPECSYFLKTGDCKFKSNCKYHHPKERFLKSPPLALSEEGLPLRPNQEICSYYSRYGICKFGPACKFDHSVHLAKPGLRSQSPMENFLVEDDPLMSRSRIAGDPFVVQQQPLQEVQISAFFGF